jgi:hypothetical protein
VEVYAGDQRRRLGRRAVLVVRPERRADEIDVVAAAPVAFQRLEE